MSQSMSDKLAASVRGVKQAAADSKSVAPAAVVPAVKEVEKKMVTPDLSTRRVWPD
ncbi:hypothetical protein ACFL2V_02445 [Pseudomonadota bacterium]